MSKERKTDERILRDQIIRKASVDNMTNIARQRADLKQGIMPVAPDRKSATELAEDRTAQAGMALQNLLDLGFKDAEAHEIADSLDLDGRIGFNRAYPQIKADFEKRFNVRTTSPAFFIEYLHKFLDVLTATSGVPSNLAYAQDNLITTPNDMLKLILTSESMVGLYDELERNYGMDTYGALAITITELIDALPDVVFLGNLNTVMTIDAVKGFQAIQALIKILKPLPSLNTIDKVLKDRKSTASQKKRTLLDDLAVLTPRDYAELEAIKNNINAMVTTAPPSVPTLSLTLPPASTTPPATVSTPPTTPPATATASAVAKPTPKLSFPKIVLELFTNSTGGDICVSKYSKSGDKYYAIYVIDSSGIADCFYGLDWSEFNEFLKTYIGNIESSQKGFHIRAMYDSTTKHFKQTDIDKLLGTIAKNPSAFNTKSIGAISDIKDFIEWDTSTHMSIGAGLKRSKSKKKVSPKHTTKHTGLKPIKLGTGMPSYPVDNLKAVEPKKTIKLEKPDPYKMYNEELGLHPIKMEKKVKEEKPKKEKKHKVAEGIDGGEPTERYIALGKFAVNMRQLKKGVLQVVYKSLAVNPNFNPRPISNEFHNYLHELLTNKHSIQSLYKLIPDEEKELFERLTISAGVFDKLGIPKIGILDKDKNEMERFKLLHGEFLAGNDNTSMIRELRNLILKFLSENRISKNKAYEYLLELNG
jgi:hypothetical protein